MIRWTGLAAVFAEGPEEREFFIDNLLVRIHFIIVMIRWTGLAAIFAQGPEPCRGTSLIRTPPLLGPYSRTLYPCNPKLFPLINSGLAAIFAEGPPKRDWGSEFVFLIQGLGFRVSGLVCRSLTPASLPSESGPLRAVHLSRHKWPGD